MEQIPSSTDRINIVKVIMLPESVFRFNAILINLPIKFFIETEKSTLKFI